MDTAIRSYDDCGYWTGTLDEGEGRVGDLSATVVDGEGLAAVIYLDTNSVTPSLSSC